VGNEPEHGRLEHAFDEAVPLVGEIREPRRAGLGPELGSRALALLGEERVDSVHEPCASLGREHPFEPRPAPLVQLAPSLPRDRHPEMVCAFGSRLSAGPFVAPS
jgi:hypothetical protein